MPCLPMKNLAKPNYLAHRGIPPRKSLETIARRAPIEKDILPIERALCTPLRAQERVREDAA